MRESTLLALNVGEHTRPVTFDEYCAGHGITEEERPAAFAAYLHLLSGGESDGDYCEVDPAG